MESSLKAFEKGILHPIYPSPGCLQGILPPSRCVSLYLTSLSQHGRCRQLDLRPLHSKLSDGRVSEQLCLFGATKVPLFFRRRCYCVMLGYLLTFNGACCSTLFFLLNNAFGLCLFGGASRKRNGRTIISASNFSVYMTEFFDSCIDLSCIRVEIFFRGWVHSCTAKPLELLPVSTRSPKHPHRARCRLPRRPLALLERAPSITTVNFLLVKGHDISILTHSIFQKARPPLEGLESSASPNAREFYRK